MVAQQGGVAVAEGGAGGIGQFLGARKGVWGDFDRPADGKQHFVNQRGNVASDYRGHRGVDGVGMGHGLHVGALAVDFQVEAGFRRRGHWSGGGRHAVQVNYHQFLGLQPVIGVMGGRDQQQPVGAGAGQPEAGIAGIGADEAAAIHFAGGLGQFAPLFSPLVLHWDSPIERRRHYMT